MGVDLKINGSELVRRLDGSRPHRYDPVDFTITEDSTPIHGSDSSGGTGQVELTVNADFDLEGTELLVGSELELVDDGTGRTRGFVSGLRIGAQDATIVADSPLAAFVANARVLPFVGTLGDAIMYYLNVAGIPDTSDVSIDPSLASRPVAIPGWYGEMWAGIKELCVAEQIEIIPVSGVIVARPIRTIELVHDTDVSVQQELSSVRPARYVQVYNYNSTPITNGPVYPSLYRQDEPSIIQVDAGETTQVRVELGASLVSVQQPVPQAFVPRDQWAISAYSVIDKDGNAVTPQDWTRNGGNVSVELLPDSSSIQITVVGASLRDIGPFRIASANTPEDVWHSLRILGTGLGTRKELITIPTGADESSNPQEIGITIDSPFITDAARAYAAGISAARSYIGPTRTISVEAISVNRRDLSGAVNVPSFGDFNSEEGDITFSAFNAAWAGATFAELNAYYDSLVADRFENQASGNIAGARVEWRYANYRVRSASIKPLGVSYTAEEDTTFGDFNELWAGRTFADLGAAWLRYTGPGSFRDFAIQPLRPPI